MAQRTPVRPPIPRPRITRTPYGWDCQMEDGPSVIPSWDEPEEEQPGRMRQLMTWALVPLAVGIVALVASHAPTIGGTPTAVTPAATAAPKAAPTDPPVPAAPQPRATPQPTVAGPAVAPALTPTPPPVATPAPPAAAPAAAQTAHVTGLLTAASPPTCNNGGRGAPGPPLQCQWGLTATEGSTVNFNLTWPEEVGLQLTIWGPPGTNDGKPLYTGQSTGPIAASITKMPAKSVVIVSRPGDTGTCTFDVKITMAA